MTLYLYHWVPKNMTGKVLYPLNELKEKEPEVFAVHAAKYEGRKQVMDWKVPRLNCKWNDVIHLTAVHPRVVKDAMIAAGDTGEYTVRCFQIDPQTLDPEKTIVYLYIKEPQNGEVHEEEFVPFHISDMEKYAVIPDYTKAYYKRCFDEGKIPLELPWVPHIFYKGSIDISDAKIVEA